MRTMLSIVAACALALNQEQQTTVVPVSGEVFFISVDSEPPVPDLAPELPPEPIAEPQPEQSVIAEPEVPDLTPEPQYTTRQVTKYRSVRVKHCDGRRCWYTTEQRPYIVTERVPVAESQPATDYATPPEIGNRILTHLNPRRDEIFLDVGSGDGRFVIEAACRFGCRAIGIELDPGRIAIARAAAERRGVSHLVTFIEGDFTKVDWPKADVGYAYLFPEDLQAVKDRLLKLNRFATFAHEVPGVAMQQHGDFYSWRAPQVSVAKNSQPVAWYNGRAYTHPVCNKSNCSMCNWIRSQLASQGG